MWRLGQTDGNGNQNANSENMSINSVPKKQLLPTQLTKQVLFSFLTV